MLPRVRRAPRRPRGPVKKIAWIAVGLAGVALAALAAHQWVVEGGGEVVVLRTFDAEDRPHETRLWIVDHRGARWLNAGAPEAAWLIRLQENPQVEVTDDARTRIYTAVPVLEERDAVLRLMREKYAGADRYVRGIMGEASVPVRLDPR